MGIGFIDLGTMGAPMARNLARAQHRLALYSRTSESANRAAADAGRAHPRLAQGGRRGVRDRICHAARGRAGSNIAADAVAKVAPD